MTKLYQH